MNSILIALTSLVWMVAAHATIQVGPLTFDEPSGFTCQQDDAQTICTDPKDGLPKKSVILATLKIRGTEDALPQFKAELSQPRELQSGPSQTRSTVIKSGDIKINDWDWVEAVHRNSEVQGYITHYYATVTDGYAILLTHSTAESEYNRMAKIFAASVGSMKIGADQEFTAAPDSSSVPGAAAASGETTSKRNRNIVILAVCGLLAAGVLFYAGRK